MATERADSLEAPDADYTRVLNRIDQLAELQPGWNSYRAPAINEAARRRAKNLVLMFFERHVPAPSVSPTPSGGVLLHWDVLDREVQIFVDRVGGSYSVAQVDSPDFLVYGEELELVDPYKDIVRPYVQGLG